MAIDPNLLISATFGNYTSNYLQGSETASFYIHDFDTEEILLMVLLQRILIMN